MTTEEVFSTLDVVGSGEGVGLGLGLGGSGFGVGLGGGGGGAAPLPKSHSPYMIPASSDAKNENSPGVRSRPPYGHPGHC